MMSKKLSSKPEIPTMKREPLSGFAVFEPQQSCFRNMSLCIRSSLIGKNILMTLT